MPKSNKKVYSKVNNLIMGFDKPLMVTLLGLLLFGILAVFNSSIVIAARDFGNQYHFIWDQVRFLAVGLVIMYIVSRFDYHLLYKAAIPLLMGVLVLLLVVFIPGIGVHVMGAKRWINLGFSTLQPTELAKLVLVIYLSAWFSNREKQRFVPFLLLLIIVVGLVVLQPDLGTAVIITFIALGLYFISGAPVWHFLMMLPVVGVALGLIAVAAPYRFARITTFFNPDRDPLGASYHVRQILIALGSGGLWGLGLGKSRQKYEYLPEANTDSVFAIIAEELGYIGSIVLIGLFMFITWRIFYIARKAPDNFGKMMVSGIGIWFSMQTIINLASMVVLVPLTGVPLPLISYGGSNLVSMLIGFGIVFSVCKQSSVKQKGRIF